MTITRYCRCRISINDNIIGIVSDLYNGSEYVIYEDEISSEDVLKDVIETGDPGDMYRYLGIRE